MQLRAVLKWVAGGVLAIGAVLTIAALTPRQWGSLPRSGNCEHVIYVSSDGFHVNLFVPVRTAAFDWSQRLNLNELRDRAPQSPYRYLQFGWGDRAFYMNTPSWDRVQPTDALRALFAPSNASALLVKGHTDIPHYPNEELNCIRLGQRDYQALMTFIAGSFQVGDQGPIRLGSDREGTSSFYAAHGHYSVLRTCNSWTAEGLRAAQVNTPVWDGLATVVMRQVRNGCSCKISGS
ncbi:DUF2459 domain-containing protein [Leptolyngbya sp. FACHB-36]|uniref:DUF2459 domain-containing protein n=1 Tax=Leptolyngbya sp. FACHB-36 TaxID=2692808 RepID=UPI001997DB6D|nr:DUF2459 domain-containing protein [Leptolyngbya sp. FACHB-36]MBD2022500.1 DUF2459 domain-containing protein [Leptolyngbya sp. FACHB-36]